MFQAKTDGNEKSLINLLTKLNVIQIRDCKNKTDKTFSEQLLANVNM